MIRDLLQWFAPGGVVMYLLLFGFLPLVTIAGLLHLILSIRRSFVQLAVCLVLTFAAGTLTTSWQRSRVSYAVMTTVPAERLHLAIVGYDEAGRPAKLGFAIVLFGLFPYTIGELRRSRRKAS